ncbi:hypothetical protein EOM86_03460 [Candidatus Nomurabacteria bacterium]|jgi:hypothetical protein|nr:hypothetical protein [Candidatus Nomurabacteria bacterium]
MSGYDNIKEHGFDRKAAEERRELAKKAGKASGEVRRRKKAMREQMEMLLALKAKPEELKNKMEILGIDSDNMDNQMALITALYAEALKGDVGAFNSIRDLVGEKPTDKLHVDMNANIEQGAVEMEAYVKELWEKEKMKK